MEIFSKVSEKDVTKQLYPNLQKNLLITLKVTLSS